MLDNLQRECERSYQNDRTKLVELEEVREMLKMTKDVNRELMDEINGKEYVISECRKIYSKLTGGKSVHEYRSLRSLLNIQS